MPLLLGHVGDAVQKLHRNAKVLERKPLHKLLFFDPPPVELTDKESIHRDIDNLKAGLGGAPPESAFMGAISPGQIAFNYPNHYYSSHEEYLGVLAKELAYEYNAIVDAGLNLQIDSPDLAMSAHSRSVGSSITSWDQHLPLAIEASTRRCPGSQGEGAPAPVLGQLRRPASLRRRPRQDHRRGRQANVGTIYPEGGNPRHEHEWRVFLTPRSPAT
jgi:5-methyltetrahydropteroyltriglutamate--homocysteine methyltransferase